MENIRTYEFNHIATFKPHALQSRRAYQKELKNENAEKNLLQENDRNGEYNGYISDATKRIIKKRLDNWLLSVQYTTGLKNPMKVSVETTYPTFVTLTLPSKQIHTDQKIKNEVLDPYIEWLRKTFKVTAYFWRAESQKNGDLHFHLIIDKYVPYGEIRRKWNVTVNRLGYVDRYVQMQKFRFRYGYTKTVAEIDSIVASLQNICKQTYKTKQVKEGIDKKLREFLFRWKASKKTVSRGELVKIAEKIHFERYEKAVKEGFKNPPSTEIKSIQNLSSVTAYVTKYVTKDSKKKLQTGERYEKRDGKECIVSKKIEVVNGENFELEQVRPVEYEARKVKGHLWGCSDTLRHKGLDYFKQEFAYEISWLNQKTHEFERSVTVTSEATANYVTEKINSADKIIDLDYIKIIPSRKPISDGLPVAVMESYKNHYRNTYQLIYAQAV